MPQFAITYPRNRAKRALIRIPIVGRLVVFTFRARRGLRPLLRYLRSYIRWLFTSREWTNLTSNITPHNRRELVEFVHLLTDADRETVAGFMIEAEEDRTLNDHVSATVGATPYYSWADKDVRIGKRIGWYAMIRAIKPAVVVESGIDKGLGSCVIAAALLRNKAEGSPGLLYALDIEETSGWLLGGPYNEVVEHRIGDSHDTLKNLERPIDLFIHDSNHSYDHERGEYGIIRDNLSKYALILSDNSHECTALMDFAAELGKSYHFWHERPDGAFYPVGGIGAVPTA